MLKFIFLRNQKIPVPIPLRDMYSALAWISDAFCSDEQIITRATLDDRDVDLDGAEKLKQLVVDADSVVTIQIDEAKDLSLQTLEAVKDFATVVMPRVKQLAVDLYKGPKESMVEEFEEMMLDLDFIFDLRLHINGILDQHHEVMAPFQGLSHVALVVKRDLVRFQSKKMWHEAAISLLGRLEPFLKELIQEIESLQIMVSQDQSVLISSDA
jgi:hypothetical protein